MRIIDEYGLDQGFWICVTGFLAADAQSAQPDGPVFRAKTLPDEGVRRAIMALTCGFSDIDGDVIFARDYVRKKVATPRRCPLARTPAIRTPYGLRVMPRTV